MKPLLIIKAGSKLDSLEQTAGDFENWISSALKQAIPTLSIQTCGVYRGQRLPRHSEVSAVIITGSSAMVTDKDEWITSTASWLKPAVASGVPVLGICFGHQLLAYALGGQVANNPNGVEVGISRLHLTNDATHDVLFNNNENSETVYMSHRQTVMQLPQHAVRLAFTQKDQNAAFRIGDSAWGVQFHPEFTADITRAYQKYYEMQGDNIDQYITQSASITESFLQSFIRYVVESNNPNRQ